ncbi:MAG: thiamine phosphate synthase [Desulfobacterales bacterium]|nr:thiamine phosphate synthase [Desulfobacterales bacterium]
MEGIYLVTDQKACLGRSLESIVEAAAAQGLCCVQLREKKADTRTFLEQAQALKSILAGTGIPLVINDRLDIALAVEAEGVHIGQSDMPYDTARRLLGPNALIGLSVESWEDVEAAQDMELAYIGVSPVFATPTKTDTKTPWGLEGLAKIRAFSRHPLVAIGAVNATNAESVIQAGAHSLAVVSAICSASDPGAATQELNAFFK